MTGAKDDDLLSFIAVSFPSVWALELLLTVKREGGPLTRQELVSKLRASELVVSRAVDALIVAGLASIEGEVVAYLPVNSEVERCVEGTEQLYRSRPNAVRRAIITAGTSSAAAFADAFRLRRNGDD